MKKSFFFFKNNWSSNSSKKIVRTIFLILKKKKNVNFFLTGGKTSIKLYKELKKKVFPLLGEYLNFFLTDERYVSKTSKFSNSKLIIDNFFKNYSDNRKFYPIYKSANNNYSIKKKIKDYEKKISSIDIILLSLAEDGHIAGLFPNYYRLNDKRQYFFFKKKKDKFYRISLTMKSILKAKFIFILVNGKKRLKIFNELKKKTKAEIPAKILYNKAIWLIKK